MEYNEFERIVRKSFPEVGDTPLEQFRQMEPLYSDWNSKINVISRKDIANLYDHHILHSLAIARYIMQNEPSTAAALEEGASVLDLGTGGGFPGIPFAIMFPKAKVTLCDSVGKKIKVAGAVAESLGLANTVTVNDRAENLPGTFDYVISRAVASLTEFYPWVRKKYSKGIFYLRGGDIAEETGELMGRFSLPKGSVHVWSVSSWLEDPWFEGKYLVRIDKKS